MKYFIFPIALSVFTLTQAAITRDGLKHHLVEAFSKNRYYGTPEVRLEVIKYIRDFFQDLADESNGFVDSQHFMYFLNKTGLEYPGENVLLVLKGTRWGTSEDRVSIVGAHHDSQEETYGVNDNGAAMSVLLEAAREVSLTACTRLNSVIFVAFDWEEFGLIGSEIFVNQYLVPSILKKFSIPRETYRGAFIMDTIMNHDDEANSQDYPPGTAILFPKLYRWLKARDYRGNFLLTIGRRDESPLFTAFSKHWNDTYGSDIHGSGPFDQLNIQLPFRGNPSDSWLGSLIRDFFRSDHYYFWECDDDYTSDGLEAIFLSDSANFRGYMRDCYHQWCDDMSHVTDTRLDFLRVITTSLTTMFTEFATEKTTCRYI